MEEMEESGKVRSGAPGFEGSPRREPVGRGSEAIREERVGSGPTPDSRLPTPGEPEASLLPTPGLRVAFVTVGDTSRLTGGYLYHARVFAGLEGFGIEVEEVVPSGASVEEQEAGVSALASFDPRGYDVVVVDALARVVCAPFVEGWRKYRPVVAMVHELPGVAAPGGDDGRERGFEEALLRSDLLIAVSGHGGSVLEGRGVPAERIRIVPPGFDGVRGARDPDAPGDGVVRALCVAQWIERKGIPDLVAAWKSLNAPNASLRLVGETDADPAYSSKVMDLIGGDPSIEISGTLDAPGLASAYASSDLFALPSRYEGYGVVYAEALSFGLPVVACEVGPVPEVVGDEAAILVPPGDIEGLANALHRLLSDEDLRERMSESALRRAGSLPRWEDTTRGFAAVLEEAAGRG